MQPNLEKTEAMEIRRHRSAQTLKTSIAMGHHEVEYVTSQKILAITIDKGLRFDKHIQ